MRKREIMDFDKYVNTFTTRRATDIYNELVAAGDETPMTVSERNDFLTRCRTESNQQASDIRRLYASEDARLLKLFKDDLMEEMGFEDFDPALQTRIFDYLWVRGNCSYQETVSVADEIAHLLDAVYNYGYMAGVTQKEKEYELGQV